MEVDTKFIDSTAMCLISGLSEWVDETIFDDTNNSSAMAATLYEIRGVLLLANELKKAGNANA